MIRTLTCAAAVWLAAVTQASAQFVLFSGAGYVTAATFQCFGEGIANAAFVLGAYLPANLGTNGAGAQFSYSSLPQSVKPHATALKSTEPMTTTFLRVNGTTITPLEVRTYKPSIKVKTKPAVLEATTPNADLEISIRNGQGVADCDFTMSLNAGRRPG